mmetsp:Transcript_57719/g.153876  ORF Transcript_57719/g.153876 Transcript_57719/m.153876 type:complete len:207 (-) Transcript_57719:1200-1820(-)
MILCTCSLADALFRRSGCLGSVLLSRTALSSVIRLWTSAPLGPTSVRTRVCAGVPRWPGPGSRWRYERRPPTDCSPRSRRSCASSCCTMWQGASERSPILSCSWKRRRRRPLSLPRWTSVRTGTLECRNPGLHCRNSVVAKRWTWRSPRRPLPAAAAGRRRPLQSPSSALAASSSGRGTMPGRHSARFVTPSASPPRSTLVPFPMT